MDDEKLSTSPQVVPDNTTKIGKSCEKPTFKLKS